MEKFNLSKALLKDFLLKDEINLYLPQKYQDKLILNKSGIKFKILNNSKQGYMYGCVGDGLVTNQFTGGGCNNTGARGRVQSKSIPTIQTSKNSVGVITTKGIRYLSITETFLLMGLK